MRTLSKIGLTFLVLIIASFIVAILKEAQGGSNGGLVAMIFTIGIVAAITAIWKWKPENEKNKSNTSSDQRLDKR